MKKILKIFGVGIFWLVLASLAMKIFAPAVFDKTFSSFKDRFNPKIIEDHILTIGYAENLNSLDPTSYSLPNRQRLINVYEGLVGVDRDLKIQPALALSWGMIDETTWEFNLRPKVKFHDGSAFDSEDVKASFDRAKNFAKSEVLSLMNTVKEVQVLDPLKIRIITTGPDPILLNKLAAIFIFPAELKDTVSEKAVGTGAYGVINWKKDERLRLELFADYYGQTPRYRKVDLVYLPDKDVRTTSLIEGKIDMLGEVPFVTIPLLKEKGLKILNQPSLEVNFLVFDQRQTPDNIFANRDLREAVRLAIDKKVLIDVMGGFARPADQFVSRGIFGFNQNISAPLADLKKANDLVTKVEAFNRLSTELDLSYGLEVLAHHIVEQLGKIGIDVKVNYLAPADFQKKIQSGKSHSFFLGWKSELGDVSDFYQAVVHSRDASGRFGQYNAGIYANKKVDALIEDSQKLVDDIPARLEKLTKVMSILTDEDIFGMPLFETEVIFGLSPKIDWQARVDGYILAREVR